MWVSLIYFFGLGCEALGILDWWVVFLHRVWQWAVGLVCNVLWRSVRCREQSKPSGQSRYASSSHFSFWAEKKPSWQSSAEQTNSSWCVRSVSLYKQILQTCLIKTTTWKLICKVELKFTRDNPDPKAIRPPIFTTRTNPGSGHTTSTITLHYDLESNNKRGSYNFFKDKNS
jgi:hypothetical protein